MASSTAKGQTHAVIIAGGSGTRFWPASRRLRPKQMLALAPGSERSLLQLTVERLAPLVPSERILVATGEHLLKQTAANLPELPEENLLAEPAARNTAPCIAWATARIAQTDPDGLVAVFPADHLVADEPAFLESVKRALELAEEGKIATIGLAPHRPETGYGYIEQGESLGNDGYAVKRFVEKPNAERAAEYLKAGTFLWNGGMFFFKASRLAAELAKHLPELWEGVQAIVAAEAAGNGAAELQARFGGLPSVSIDVGIMEKAEDLAVVAGDFGWSDLGSWQSTWELGTKDEQDNVVQGQGLLIESNGNLVQDLRSAGNQKLVALVAVDGLAVVQTDDALLILPREQAQDVRKVVAALKKQNPALLEDLQS